MSNKCDSLSSGNNIIRASKIQRKLDTRKINNCINELLEMGAISKCQPTVGQHLSKIFVVPKPNGSNRFILILKNLNTFRNTKHFKLEDIRTAIKLISKNCYFGTIDLKDSYFVIPINEGHK